jgi:3-keto-disaccharide hydrolase
MKRILTGTVLLTLVLNVRAADSARFEAKLTPREVAEGWILLFDGKTTFGWTTPTGSKWTIYQGMLAPQGEKPCLLVTTTEFSDYDLSIELRQAGKGNLELRPCCDPDGKARIPFRLNPPPGSWWRVTLQVHGGRVTGENYESVSGISGFGTKTARVPTADLGPRRGHLALAGSGFIVRNVKLKPTGTRALLGNKELSGWKKYRGAPGREKSTFSRTPEGWLHVKNGPGDLQTEEQWADFVLQLDCKTNGKNLNSGVFFRCLPAQYQQGYEAQIHNGFSDPPGKEYTIEVYDPKTHKLVAKKKERSTALDYGTGAIYRRQPARFQMARDREWFTMTVVADGRHLATWVNGVQVVDWTDNRPDANNARQGYYPKKGPISLQGHDPTTDLLFRNIRIAELPGKDVKK